MKISVEFLLRQHETDVFDVGRIPCVGEYVYLGDETFEVNEVLHKLNAHPEAQVRAIIRVK